MWALLNGFRNIPSTFRYSHSLQILHPLWHLHTKSRSETKTWLLKVVKNASSQSLQGFGGYTHPGGKEFNDVMFHSLSATGFVFGVLHQAPGQCNQSLYISMVCDFCWILPLAIPHPLLSVLDNIWRQYWRCCEQLSARPASKMCCFQP